MKEAFQPAPTKDTVKLTISSKEGGVSIIVPGLKHTDYWNWSYKQALKANKK